MGTSLFREEALASYSSPQLGDIQQDDDNTFVAIAVCLVVALTLLGWLVGTSPYSRKHFVVGRIDESSANAIVATDRGYVDRLNVREGQFVAAGTHVMTTIRTTDGRSSAIADETRQQIRHWQSRHRAVEASLDRQTRTLLVNERQLAMLETLTREGIELQESKVEQLQAHLTNTAGLVEAGYLSNLDWIRFRTNLISEQQQLNVLRTRFIGHQRARTELQAKRADLATQRQTQMAEAGSTLSRLRERLIELEQDPFQELVATRSGTITRIETTAGASIQPGQPLAYIGSPETVVTGTLSIPPDAAGHLVKGQQLALELDAFPAQTYGRINATITQLSPHTVSMPNQRGYFLARLNIEPSPRLTSILPGMTFKTFIPVEQRTLFSWFLKPLEKLEESLR